MTAPDRDYEELSRLAHDWRERVQSEEATHADRAALDAWLAEDIRHEEAYDRALTYWVAFDHLKAEDIDADLMPPASTPENWIDRLLSRSKAAFPAYRLPVAAAAAALVAVLALAVLWPYMPDGGPSGAVAVVYSTDVAQTKSVTLKDGTVVTLGARTEIGIALTKHARRVVLKSGAALFDVEPDPSRPFSVKTGDLTATALGTVFDVRSNGGVYRVAVAEGRVEVAYPYYFYGWRLPFTSRRTLEAGQEVAATGWDGLRDVRNLPVADVGAWRRRKLIYDNGTLGELVADANRYSTRKIVLADDAQSLSGRTLTASFDANNIGRILSMLVLSYPIELDESEAGVVRIHPGRAGEQRQRRTGE